MNPLQVTAASAIEKRSCWGHLRLVNWSPAALSPVFLIAAR